MFKGISIPIDKDPPWLITKKKSNLLCDEQGNRLSAEYIYSKKGIDRINLLKYVFNYYRNKGFPYPENNINLKNDYIKLCKRNVNDVISGEGYIKNTNILGLNICRYFTKKLYYSSKGINNLKSCIDVFNDDNLFIKVLMNRMGWNTTKEGGIERTYIFSIDDAMIIQGMRSSGLAYIVSQFKPLMAKYLCNKFAKNRVLDFSAGWGARALGAISLGLQYIGIDPLTYNNINSLIEYFNGNGSVINGCSEDENIYTNIGGKFDFIFSSPPYFNQEIYCNSITQCYNRYTNYQDWLNIYWKNTILNCLSVLENNGFFSFIMLDKISKFDIALDMLNICKNNNLILYNILPFNTITSHLSNKSKSLKYTKNSEKVYILKKK